MKHTDSDDGITMINESLSKIFKINKSDMMGDDNTSKKSGGAEYTTNVAGTGG